MKANSIGIKQMFKPLKLPVVVTSLTVVLAMIGTSWLAVFKAQINPMYLGLPLFVAVFFLTVYLIHHLIGPVPIRVILGSLSFCVWGFGWTTGLQLAGFSDADTLIYAMPAIYLGAMFMITWARRAPAAAKQEAVVFLNALPSLERSGDFIEPNEVRPGVKRSVGIFLILCSTVGMIVIAEQLKQTGVGDFYRLIVFWVGSTTIFSSVAGWMQGKPQQSEKFS